MCKPSVKRVPVPWLPAFHGCKDKFGIDPDLLLLHAKFFDVEHALASHRTRAARYLEGAVGTGSTWSLTPKEMAAEMDDWISADTGTAAELDVDQLDLDVVRPHRSGGWRSRGSQVKGMRESQLFRLPDSLRLQF
jgi:hypothetical protein